MQDKRLEELKNEYKNVPIPDELDFVVRKALKDSEKVEKKSSFKLLRNISVSAAAAIVIIVLGISSGGVFRGTLSRMLGVSSAEKMITFKQEAADKEKSDTGIKTARLYTLEDNPIEENLNEKYIEENKRLYKEFMSEINMLKGNDKDNLKVKTDNDTILSVEQPIMLASRSLNRRYRYYTVDKKSEILISLPSLFKDDSYIDVISKEIIKQMREEMKMNKNKVYFIDNYEDGEDFEKISKDQNFYINNDGKLVIFFSEYEIAPEYMGSPEFIIPTESISSILVSNYYIK